ncbi:MAG: hypothetical protein JWP63_6416, partial [Candidatus Solibacter sp.]|nr:hypothetical protein [Candidatus Solibacter sp.]
EMEVTKSTLPDGLNNVSGIGHAGEDHLGFGADGADAAEEFEGIEAIIGAAGEDEINVSGADPIEGLTAVRHLFDFPVVPFQETGQVSLGGGIGIEQKQVAGRQKNSTL